MLVFDDPHFDLHDPGPDHPERAARLGAARAGLAGLAGGWTARTPRVATPAELETVHTASHVARVLAADGRTVMLDPDTITSAGSVQAALRAAGAALEAAAALLDGEASLVLCRPPGHHAPADRAMGFCLLNNAALAAQHLAAAGKRVLVFDPDVHHGNGTEAIFWERPDVLFVSLHQAPFYPGTGAAHAHGAGAGRGTPAGAGDALYAEAMRARVLPAVRRYRPDVCVISAGFDALAGDPLGGMRLSAAGMAALWASLLDEGLPALAVLEGGYSLDNLTTGVAACAGVLSGQGPRPALSTAPCSAGQRQNLTAVPHPLLGD